MAALICVPPTASAEDALKPGAKLETLPVGAKTYRDVQVRSINARTVVITHSGGLTAIPLRELSPEWQARFNYSPEAEAAAEKASAAATKQAPRPTNTRPAAAAVESKFAQLQRQFGTVANVQAEIDLRPKFFALELHVKNQGRRPSCAIFAVVCALEFQNAELTGQVEKFSEEYLMWALRTHGLSGVTLRIRDEEDSDIGFSLLEVAAAIRANGIPLQASMPNSLGRKVSEIEEPSAEVLMEARRYRRVLVHELPGYDGQARTINLVHALNAGIPVAVGMAWPQNRILGSGYLDEQTPLPGAGHAVTMVGYKSTTGQLNDAVFVFKNSYGPTWGQGGYGYATYRYLSQHLDDGLIIEVQPGDDARAKGAGK
jgi:C1A family cysteine protease